MRSTIATIAAAAAAVIATSTPSQAAGQDWPMPPSSIILEHVAGTMSTGFYLEGHRYGSGIPVAFTLPRIGIIRNVTCATDTTGACDDRWTSYYRSLAAFRDAEQLAKTGRSPARHASPVTR